MKIDQKMMFPVKVAFFNTLGFCLMIASTTYVDARLTSHVVWGARHYRFGYWLLLCAPLIFVGTLWCGEILHSWKMKAVCPSLVLVLFGVCSLPFFRPEMPHTGISLWLLMYCFASLVASWIHYLPIEPDWLKDATIDKELRVERTKEAVDLWRNIALSITFGYVALLIPWSNSIWEIPSYMVTKKEDLWLLGLAGGFQVAAFTIYILFGVTIESFKKASKVADLLLKIKA